MHYAAPLDRGRVRHRVAPYCAAGSDPWRAALHARGPLGSGIVWSSSLVIVVVVVVRGCLETQDGAGEYITEMRSVSNSCCYTFAESKLTCSVTIDSHRMAIR
jgi:hypothetical protein